MELEFDKEIDAILRKARPNKGVLVGDDPPEPKEPRDQKPHVDADAIAAFVQNALPDKTRRLYMEHFADCDGCRKQLSFAMQMMPDAVPETDTAPAVLETVPETVIPWYQSIFRSPNLAVAMGALILAFSGILGYLVLNQQQTQTDATVAKQTQMEQRHGGPYEADQNSDAIPTPSEVPTVSLNANAAAASNAAIAERNDAPNSAMKPAEMEMPPAANAAPDTRGGQFQVDGASGSENNFIIDGQDVSGGQVAKKSAAAPAKPSGQSQADSSVSSQSAELLPKGVNMSSVLKTSPSAGAATDRDEKKAEGKTLKEADKDRGNLAKRKPDDRRASRDAPPPPTKSGPAQSNQSNVGQMSVTRVVSGKTFSNRDGAWYDSAYKNQATTNVRRGTSEYKKLDSGLRSIADSLGGTVVVVWKSKAYRIQ